jgi:hypothetical protein
LLRARPLPQIKIYGVVTKQWLSLSVGMSEYHGWNLKKETLQFGYSVIHIEQNFLVSNWFGSVRLSVIDKMAMEF